MWIAYRITKETSTYRLQKDLSVSDVWIRIARLARLTVANVCCVSRRINARVVQMTRLTLLDSGQVSTDLPVYNARCSKASASIAIWIISVRFVGMRMEMTRFCTCRINRKIDV